MARKGGLTVIGIENLAAKSSRYEVPDPACPGLYLSVFPTGAKSWCFRYRFGGKSRKLTMGVAFTDKDIEIIEIGDARDIADEARRPAECAEAHSTVSFLRYKSTIRPRERGHEANAAMQAAGPYASWVFVNPKVWAIGKAEVNDNRARWYGLHERSPAKLR